MKRKTPIFNLTSEIRFDDLIEQMAGHLTHEQVFEFIVSLDKALVDWEFTETLFNHFSQEMRKLAEDKE